jgi:hypothetical protein
MPRSGPLPLLLTALLALCGGCSGLAPLDEPPAATLAPSEQAAVRAKADEALAQGRYNAAWNQEVAAGADRARLEAIAVQALAGRSLHAADMLRALEKRFGGLGPEARARADALVARARTEGHWQRALEVALAAADDAPHYEAAWAVYRDAPPEVASSLLEMIQDARKAREESSD